MPRLVVARIGVRLQVTIDSWAGGTTLNYRIKRGAVSIANGTLEAAAGVGAKLAVCDVTGAGLTGAATYTVFLWVNAGSCVVSVCQLQVGVGTTQSTSNILDCMSLTFAGWVTANASYRRVGTGNFGVHLSYSTHPGDYRGRAPGAD